MGIIRGIGGGMGGAFMGGALGGIGGLMAGGDFQTQIATAGIGAVMGASMGAVMGFRGVKTGALGPSTAAAARTGGGGGLFGMAGAALRGDWGAVKSRYGAYVGAPMAGQAAIMRSQVAAMGGLTAGQPARIALGRQLMERGVPLAGRPQQMSIANLLRGAKAEGIGPYAGFGAAKAARRGRQAAVFGGAALGLYGISQLGGGLFPTGATMAGGFAGFHAGGGGGIRGGGGALLGGGIANYMFGGTLSQIGARQGGGGPTPGYGY